MILVLWRGGFVECLELEDECDVSDVGECEVKVSFEQN